MLEQFCPSVYKFPTDYTNIATCMKKTGVSTGELKKIISLIIFSLQRTLDRSLILALGCKQVDLTDGLSSTTVTWSSSALDNNNKIIMIIITIIFIIIMIINIIILPGQA